MLGDVIVDYGKVAEKLSSGEVVQSSKALKEIAKFPQIIAK